MPEIVTIPERIEIQAGIALEAMPEIDPSQIERWDARREGGNEIVRAFLDRKQKLTTQQGVPGFTTWVGDLVVEMKLTQEPIDQDPEPTATLVSRWEGRINAAIMADPNFIEAATGEPLLEDIEPEEIVGTRLVGDDDVGEVVIEFSFRAQFTTNREDLTRWADIITPRTI